MSSYSFLIQCRLTIENNYNVDVVRNFFDFVDVINNNVILFSQIFDARFRFCLIKVRCSTTIALSTFFIDHEIVRYRHMFVNFRFKSSFFLCNEKNFDEKNFDEKNSNKKNFENRCIVCKNCDDQLKFQLKIEILIQIVFSFEIVFDRDIVIQLKVFLIVIELISFRIRKFHWLELIKSRFRTLKIFNLDRFFRFMISSVLIHVTVRKIKRFNEVIDYILWNFLIFKIEVHEKIVVKIENWSMWNVEIVNEKWKMWRFDISSRRYFINLKCFRCFLLIITCIEHSKFKKINKHHCQKKYITFNWINKKKYNCHICINAKYFDITLH